MAKRCLAELIIGLAIAAIVLAACGGGAEQAPAGAPAAEVVVAEQTVVALEAPAAAPTDTPAMPEALAPALSFAVVHDSFVELFRDDGVRAAVVDTAGPAAVQFAGDKAAVVDAQQVRLFAVDGGQSGQGMPVSPGSSVVFGEDRVAISHASYVAVHNASGQALFNIDTPLPVQVDLVDDLLALTGTGWAGVFHLDGRPLLNLETSGQAGVHVVDGSIVLVDDATVRFFTAGGRQAGATADRLDPTRVFIVGNRVVVSHPGWAEFFSPGGDPVARIATAGLAAAAPVDGLICLRDDGAIKLLDAQGSQVAAALPQPADAEVLCTEDRLVVVHDDWVGVYSRSGESLANIATSGRGRLALEADRLILADNELIRLLSLDGQPVAEAIRLPGAQIQVVDGRLIAMVDGQAATFDLNGAPKATMVTSGMPAVMPLAGGFLVVDRAQVRLLSPAGDAWVNVANLDSSTRVVSRK